MTMTTKHERADAVANRQRILLAARKVFAQRGRDAEVREIAERAGVGVGTLYRHFANRDELLAALLQEAMAQAVQRTHAAAAFDDPRAAVRGAIAAMAETHMHFGALLEAIHDPRLSTGCPPPQGYAEIRAAVTGIITRGIATGVFRADIDVDVATVALLQLVGVFPQLVGARSYTATADALADLFLAALEAR